MISTEEYLELMYISEFISERLRTKLLFRNVSYRLRGQPKSKILLSNAQWKDISEIPLIFDYINLTVKENVD